MDGLEQGAGGNGRKEYDPLIAGVALFIRSLDRR